MAKERIFIGIDPGARQSGVVSWDGTRVTASKTIDNWEIESSLLHGTHDDPVTVAIEQIRGYGIVAGNDTFDTCEAVGRFEMAAKVAGHRIIKIPRKDVKRHLCGNTTTNDKYVRQALIDRLGPQGSKRQPGPTFSISGHTWAALAVAICAFDMVCGDPNYVDGELSKEVPMV